MKNKILFILMIIGLSGIIIILSIFEKDNFNKRYHQHEQVDKDRITELTFSEIKSHLPVISVDTKNQKIPGSPIKGEKSMYELSDEGKTYIEVQLTLYDGDKTLNSELAQIHYRGNSSRHFDKKSYSIKFINDNQDDLPVSLLSMVADNNWTLNGPFLDRSLIRNYIAMNWAGEFMSFTPEVRFVELFVDDSYEGVYLLMEKVSRNKGRVAFSIPERNSDKTGYIIQFDRNDKIKNQLNDFVTQTFKIHPSGTELRFPSKQYLTDERKQFVNYDFSRITYNIFQMPYDINYKYADVLNVEGFYDYFIINELFRLVDAGQYSTYFYRDLRGKLTPVIWDFNNSLNNYQDSIYDETGFSLTHKVFYESLLLDRHFVEGLIRRYHHLRSTKLETERLLRYIDETVEFLGDAITRNNERWGDVYDLSKYDSPNYLHPKERNMKSYEEAVQQVKDYLKNRAEWLDTNIETLYQYSHPSRTSHKSIK